MQGWVSTDFVAPFCREKKRRRNKFDVYEAVHESEYCCVRRPIDTRTKELVEPAHQFEVVLEPDNFTEEKCGLALIRFAYAVLMTYYIDTRSLQTTRKNSITKVLLIFRKVVSSASFAPACVEVLVFKTAKKRRSALITSATA